MTNKLRYRVNYGNGQVEYPGDKRACIAWLARCDGYAYVEYQDPDTGDWFRTGTR